VCDREDQRERGWERLHNRGAEPSLQRVLQERTGVQTKTCFSLDCYFYLPCSH
jgi:hypothetical protein